MSCTGPPNPCYPCRRSLIVFLCALKLYCCPESIKNTSERHACYAGWHGPSSPWTNKLFYFDSVPHRQYDAQSVLICLRKTRLCRHFEKSRATPASPLGTQQKNNYPINKIKVSTVRVGVNSSFSRPANSHWSHFSLFHYFDTVAALWLSAAVQSDWSVRLKLSVPHCAQGAYAPLGGSHRIRSLITAAVTQHTGSNPARQISVTASLSRSIAASGPPLSSPVPSHVTGRECGVN